MRKVLLVCSLAMCASGAAFAQGEGEGEGEGEEPCGAVTALGECDGTDAIWCDTASGNLQRVTCGDLLGDGSVVGACEVYADFGSWCAMTDGDACAFQSGDQNIYFACATDTSGCVSGVCTAGTGACTPDGETPTVACLDTATIQVGCASWGQVIGIGCAEIDAASTCASDACGGIGAGGPCDGEVAVCASGLTCGSDNTCGNEGEGEGEEGEGEGEGDAECESDRDCDDGEVCTDGECVGGSEQPPLCSDTGASTGLPAAGLLALGGMVLGLRRRRA